MTPAQSLASTGDHTAAAPQRAPRLRMKPKALPTGYVDGAWWPHSADLTAELPELLATMSGRLGPTSSVTYQPGEWSKAPATMVIGTLAVRLAGNRRQPRSTVEILGSGGTSVVLLVVPPGTHPDQAHDSMTAAAQPDNNSTAAGLLVAERR